MTKPKPEVYHFGVLFFITGSCNSFTIKLGNDLCLCSFRELCCLWYVLSYDIFMYLPVNFLLFKKLGRNILSNERNLLGSCNIYLYLDLYIYR